MKAVRQSWSDLGPVQRVVLAIALVNFLAFIAGAMWLGGDALNGHEEDGRYFLASHGRLTEVSHAVFVYSTVHAISVIVTHVTAFVVIGVGKLLTRLERPDETP